MKDTVRQREIKDAYLRLRSFGVKITCENEYLSIVENSFCRLISLILVQNMLVIIFVFDALASL